jgi:hypothetical protein
MSDTPEFPSKTDSEVVPLPQLPTPAVTPLQVVQPDMVPLSQGEIDYVKGLEGRNRFLTMILGDRCMAVQEAQADLAKHRETLTAAYSYVITSHGVARGKVDTQTGLITVVERLAK